MNQSSSSAEVPDPDQVEWEDVEDFAGKLFHIWMGGGDLAWAKKAWQALAQAGMTVYTREAERSVCLARLIALSALYREFCVRAFDEGDSDEWQDDITNELVGEYPLLDAFTLGQVAEQHQIDIDNVPFSEPSALDLVVTELVREEYQGVVDVLMEQWGPNAFFTSLYVSSNPDKYDDEDSEGETSSPVTDDQIDRVMNDPTGETLHAFAWFHDGLSL